MPNCKPLCCQRGLGEQLRNCYLDNEAAESGQDFLIVPVLSMKINSLESSPRTFLKE